VSRLPLVLAIEPDVRQAAIVKRVLKERVQAELMVVDSRDAAIAAIRTAIPDVVLVSMLLSPRDEDDLIQHLRTLEGAAHLQTHTIPQLASALGRGDDDGGGGLFSSFRRKKQAASAPAGCDPDLFADEIRVYLQRAADRKREAAETGSVTPLSVGRRMSEAPAAAEEAAAPVSSSSWSSPFEWRPTSDRRTPPAPAPIEETAKAEYPFPDPLPAIPDFEPPISDLRSPIPDPPAPPVHTPAPLSVWARQESPKAVAAPDHGELETFFARLGVPDGVGSVGYPEGVRIRRVRVRPAKESQPSLHGAMLLGKRMLAELSGSDVRP
jgi:CheY-like chemotaxis protein